jgi:hypothetical protein
MWPLVIHEIMQRLAGIVTAKAAGINVLLPGALSERTLFYPIIHPVTPTTIAVQRPAGAAIKTAWTIL